MHEQEMQFANPDWQPSTQSSVGPAELEQAVPLPVNAARLGLDEKYELLAPSEPAHQEEQPQPEFLPASQRMPLYQGALVARPRWRRSWLWAIAFVLLVWLIPALFYSLAVKRVPAFREAKPFPMSTQTFNYDMTGISLVTINDPAGFIHVHAGGSSTQGQIEVQSSDQKGNPLELVRTNGMLNIVVNTPSDGGPVLLDITLPQNMALNMGTNGGDIEVDGMSGQFNFKTDNAIILSHDALTGDSHLFANQAGVQISDSSLSGSYTIISNGPINLNQVNMSGQGLVQTQGNGDIHMDGTLDPQGSYTFTTDSGQIDLTLPKNAAAQFNVDPGTGSASNDFPTTSGSAPQAQVTLQTRDGNIQVHKGA